MQPMQRHRRISSEKSSVAEDVQPSSSQLCGDTEESEGEPEEVDGLLHKRDQVEEELEQMKLKVEGMEWENRARRYHESIQKCVGYSEKHSLTTSATVRKVTTSRKCEKTWYAVLGHVRRMVSHCTSVRTSLSVWKKQSNRVKYQNRRWK